MRAVDVGYPMPLPTRFTPEVEQTKIQAQALAASAMMMFALLGKNNKKNWRKVVKTKQRKDANEYICTSNIGTRVLC